jgi:hypothetical protein
VLTSYIYQDDDLPLMGASSNANADSGLAVPWAVPWGIASGDFLIGETFTIAYMGDWLEYPIIKINGPITNPIVTNVTTGDTLDLTGVALGNDDSVTIDCRYGHKTITHSNGANMIANLSADSDLATFHLAPVDGLDETKANVITVAGELASTQTRVDITYYNRYTGI